MRLAPILHSVAALLALAALAVAAPTNAADPATRYVELVNRASDSITALAVSPTGEDAVRDIALARRVRGGGGAITLDLAGDRCLYDFHFTFRDGRMLTRHGIDVCRNDTVRVGRLPRRGDEEQPALAAAR